MSSTHLTRKEIKRDEVALAVGRTVHYAEDHRRTILLVVAGVILAIVAYFGIRFVRSQSQEKAGSALSEALKVAGAPIQKEGAKPGDPDQPSFPTAEARRERAKALFETVRKNQGSTMAADVAGVYLGSIAAEEGKLDEARKLWQDFVDDHPSDLLAGNARLNLIELDRKEGKIEKVVGDLQKLLDDADSPLPQDAVLYELASVYEAQKRDVEAKKTYQRILDEYPQSAYRSLAQQKVATGGAPLALTPG
ncbi:MAG TPA: tetratricopeptide repeat protein [Thermoanaerobaculia bacterium]|nr:tetratricopeptide repeat protein [Thermoanaerobaculia bacterium]